MGASAIIEGRYRYRLGRTWGEPGGYGSGVCFIMLNPSTADAEQDDPTIRRCIGFAKALGATKMEVVNLFALRATDPRELLMAGQADASGPDNDRHIADAVDAAEMVICAWGAHVFARHRGAAVADLVRAAGKQPMCLRVTKDGHPAHPLYLPASLRPAPFPAQPVAHKAKEPRT